MIYLTHSMNQNLQTRITKDKNILNKKQKISIKFRNRYIKKNKKNPCIKTAANIWEEIKRNFKSGSS